MEEKPQDKKLSLPALTAMVIGSMVGAGIFMIPARFAGATGVIGSLIAWVIAGLGMLTLALVFQSLAIRKPNLNAGVFSYAREGFGRYAGFIAAIGFWASSCAGNVTYLVLINSTLGGIIPPLGQGDTILAMVVGTVLIWLFFFFILKGVQGAAIINTIVTIAKLLPIIVFIGFIIFFFDFETFKSNMDGNFPGYTPSLFQQISTTMMITVFVFLGIEGASVYSRYAKTRKMVGRATILGFVSVLCLLILVSVFPFGVLSQEAIAKMSQPSMAGIMEAMAGLPGGWFISAGLIISVLGAYLAWTLMAAEVLFMAAQDGDMPAFLKKTNAKKVPSSALLLSACLTQVILLSTYFSENALDFALDLTAALALIPYFLCAAYAFKIAFKRDGYEDATKGERTKEIIIAAIASVYNLFLIWVAGLDLLPLCCIILAPVTLLFIYSRRKQGKRVFSKGEIVLFVILIAGLVFAIVGAVMGILEHLQYAQTVDELIHVDPNLLH